MTSMWTVRRSPADAKLTGLCGGVAEHWGIDPVLVRLGWVLLALSGGIGIVLYLAGWFLVPVRGSNRAPVDDFFGASGRPRWRREVWTSLVVVSTVVVFALFGSLSPFGLTPAVILAAVWYVGYAKKRARREPSSAAAPPQPAPLAPAPLVPAAVHPPSQTTPTAYADPPPREPPSREAYFAMADPVGLYTEPEPTPVLRRSDRPAARRLRLMSLVAVGLTLAGLGLADNLGMAVPLLAYLAAPLLVLGLTLVAATWVGRARGILPLALLLGVAVLTTASVPTSLSVAQDWPATNVTYSDIDRVPPGDRLDVGHLRVDLSQLDLTRSVTYQARVDAGQLEVIVPPDVNVVVDYRLDAGVVQLFGEKVAGGTELENRFTNATPAGPAGPTLTLDLALDVGTVAVHS